MKIHIPCYFKASKAFLNLEAILGPIGTCGDGYDGIYLASDP